jgi:hypothetical protein
VLFTPTDGLKYYPDQPVINDTEVATGLLGARQDSAAVVPIRAGSWTIPEIRIPWWDIESGEVRYAVLPGREISVAAADPTTVTALAPAPAIDIGTTATPTAITQAVDSTAPGQWQVVAVVSSAGWLLTLAYLAWSRRRPMTPKPDRTENPSEKRVFKQLLAACASGSALHARQALVEWSAQLFPQANVVSLSQVASVFTDESLNAQIAALNASLYSQTNASWEGTALADCARRLRNQHQAQAGRQQQELTLYPRAA